MVGPIMNVDKAKKTYKGRYPFLYVGTTTRRRVSLDNYPSDKKVSYRGRGRFALRDVLKDRRIKAGPAKDMVGGKNNPYAHSGDVLISRKGVVSSGFQDRYMKKKPVKVSKSKRARTHSRRKPKGRD